jgi:hypothetical protein
VKYWKRLGVLAIAVCLAAAPAWAQFPTSRADIMKLATDRMDTIAKKLNLSPDQVSKIKPLLQQQMEKTSAARSKFATSDHSAAAKQQALDSIEDSRSSTRNEVRSVLSQDQLKQWDDSVKDWKDDVTLEGVGNVLKK